MTTRWLTILSEDLPFEVELVTTRERCDYLELQRKAHGGMLFCEMCELDGDDLAARGFTFEHNSGVIMCLACFLDPHSSWEFITRGQQVPELADLKPGRHRS